MTTTEPVRSYYKEFGHVLANYDQLTDAQKIARFDRMYAIKVKLIARIGTHTGQRLTNRGTCEKCGTPTNWSVDVPGRAGAYWCGCGN